MFEFNIFNHQELEIFKSYFTYIIFFFGLIIGSFLNVVIYRLPIILKNEEEKIISEYLNLNIPKKEKITLSQPNSFCPCCNNNIKWFDNIPVLSYLFLKGKCRKCKTKISLRYPFIEFMTGLISATIAYTYGFSLLTLFLLIVCYFLITIWLIDHDNMIIPDQLSLTLLWIILLFSTTGLSFVSIEKSVIGAAVAYSFLFIFSYSFKKIRKKEGLGDGDLKLFSCIGALYGYSALPYLLLLSCFIAILFYIFYYKNIINHEFPFGDAISFSGLIFLFIHSYF